MSPLALAHDPVRHRRQAQAARQGCLSGPDYEAGLIVQVVSWYLRYPLSYRDIEEMLLERRLQVDHSILNHWALVQ